MLPDPHAAQDPVLVTPRLVLRELTLADVDFVATMTADPEVMRYFPRCYTRAEAEEWVRVQLERYRNDGHGFWQACDRATGERVGQVGLCRRELDGVTEWEIAYRIHRPFWRRGLATEAAAATRDHAFAVLGKPRVISLVRPENVPSQGVARKLGMTAAPALILHGGYDHLVFSLGRPEWEARRARA